MIFLFYCSIYMHRSRLSTCIAYIIFLHYIRYYFSPHTIYFPPLRIADLTYIITNIITDSITSIITYTYEYWLKLSIHLLNQEQGLRRLERDDGFKIDDSLLRQSVKENRLDERSHTPTALQTSLLLHILTYSYLNLDMCL